MRHLHRGFSLVELLVALAIVTLLAGMAFAGWSRATATARGTSCLANLRVIGIAAANFTADNNGRLPGTAHQRSSWIATLQPYLGTKKPYRCPLDPNPRRNASYAINDALSPSASGVDFSRRLNISRPSQTMFMAETADRFEGSDHFHFVDEETGEIFASGAATQLAASRHVNGSNFLFVDGHVEALTARDLARRIGAPHSVFIHPAP